MRNLPVLLFSLVLLACNPPSEPTAPAPDEAAPASQPEPQAATPAPASGGLDGLLAGKPAEFKARYEHRHPKETLEFFGIEPAMTVVEALPGGGWYSQLLVPYLGAEHSRVDSEGFHEEGAAGFGLRAGDSVATRTQAIAGLRATGGWERFGLEAYAEWQQTVDSAGFGGANRSWS